MASNQILKSFLSQEIIENTLTILDRDRYIYLKCFLKGQLFDYIINEKKLIYIYIYEYDNYRGIETQLDFNKIVMIVS